MSEWITHRLPTEGDADADGDVVVPRKSDATPDDGCNNWQNYGWVTLGQRWWPGNSSSQKAAAAEQEAAAAAPNPDPTPRPTPEPAAEPSPAVAGVPSDQELWEVQLKACKQAGPSMKWLEWNPDREPFPAALAARRALYDRGDADGYRRCLEEAKATWELNSGLASGLTALQEENAQLKSKVEDLNGEIKSLAYGINNFINVNTDKAEAKQRQFDDACKRIAELEYENAKLKDALKDLLHSRSQPQMVVVGDLEGELERRGGEINFRYESESEPTPAPELAIPEPFSCGGCRWYSDSNSETGLCCRHAPTHKGFPRVAVEGWCGDFTESTHKGNH